MDGSIRVFGNGGLFALCGWFRNDALGRYRVFGTNPGYSVALKCAEHTVVVTPDHREEFVNALALHSR